VLSMNTSLLTANTRLIATFFLYSTNVCMPAFVCCLYIA